MVENSFTVENTVLDRKTGFTKLKIQFIYASKNMG